MPPPHPPRPGPPHSRPHHGPVGPLHSGRRWFYGRGWYGAPYNWYWVDPAAILNRGYAVPDAVLCEIEATGIVLGDAPFSTQGVPLPGREVFQVVEVLNASDPRAVGRVEAGTVWVRMRVASGTLIGTVGWAPLRATDLAGCFR